jgi:hypothetical protein
MDFQKDAINTLRLLKDTLSLIKEYDWHTEYAEYDSKYGDEVQKQVAIWEQNHCGEIRNYHLWNVTDTIDRGKNMWFKMFEDFIISGKSYLAKNGMEHRCTGKSYTLSKLCQKYNGVIMYRNTSSIRGIKNCDEKLGINNTFIKYGILPMNSNALIDKIIFLDEGHGLTEIEIEKIKRNNIVIGFLK